MRAVGIVRQSRGREESLSPAEQRERIAFVCERESLELVTVHEEIDVSGGTPLAERDGLRAAVEAIESGSAQVVVVAYFDRLFRSLVVQAEVVQRVESAGGRILTADVGEVSGATPAQWISGTMLGVVSEYYRRSVRERSGEGQRMAVSEGRVVFEKGPPGYDVIDKRLVPNADAPVVAEAFRMRAEGAPIREVRAYLRQHGISRSYSTITRLLGSRAVLGELSFGDLRNPNAHPAIVDRDVWEEVQRVRETRGVRPKSDRLLARLGVLRCGTCGARMSVGFRSVDDGKRYDFYRCPPIGDCPQRVTIAADMVEGWVIEKVGELIAGVQGRASADERYRAAEVEVERTQAELDAAIRAFGGLEAEPAAIQRLEELREARDVAAERLHDLRGLQMASVITVADWPDRFDLAQRRTVIEETIRVWVDPGRGLGRLRYESVL